MTIEDIKILLGLVCVAIFQFFSLKFSYWKLKDQLKSISDANLRLEKSIKSIDNVLLNHENRIDKIEKKLLDLNGLDLKRAADDMKNFSKKQDIFLKLLAQKKREIDSDGK